MQNLCAFDLKFNIVDNGAIIRRHLGFPWSQAPLGQRLGRCRAGGVGEGEVGVGKLRQEAWITHRSSSTTRSSRFTVSDFLKEQLLYWLKPGIVNRTFENRTQSNSICGLSSIEFGNRTKSNTTLSVSSISEQIEFNRTNRTQSV